MGAVISAIRYLENEETQLLVPGVYHPSLPKIHRSKMDAPRSTSQHPRSEEQPPFLLKAKCSMTKFVKAMTEANHLTSDFQISHEDIWENPNYKGNC